MAQPEVAIPYEPLLPESPVNCEGEGVKLLVENRDKNGFDSNDNWFVTIFRLKGRAIPVMPLLLYSIYTVCVVIGIMTFGRGAFIECAEENCAVGKLSTPLTFLGSALFFLLIFRTNSSYDRWWEGRVQWGQITTTSRNLSRQAAVLIKDKSIAKEIIRWTAAYPLVLKAHIQGEEDVAGLEDVLPESDIELIQNSGHKPMHVLMRLTAFMKVCTKRRVISNHQARVFDQNLSQFQAQLAGVERIKRSAMPFAYVAQVRSLMVLWLSALPLALIHDFSWLVIPLCILVAFFVMGMEAIGVEIENPFGKKFNHLPLDVIVERCTDNVLQTMEFVDVEKEINLEFINAKK